MVNSEEWGSEGARDSGRWLARAAWLAGAGWLASRRCSNARNAFSDKSSSRRCSNAAIRSSLLAGVSTDMAPK